MKLISWLSKILMPGLDLVLLKLLVQAPVLIQMKLIFWLFKTSTPALDSPQTRVILTTLKPSNPLQQQISQICRLLLVTTLLTSQLSRLTWMPQRLILTT